MGCNGARAGDAVVACKGEESAVDDDDVTPGDYGTTAVCNGEYVIGVGKVVVTDVQCACNQCTGIDGRTRGKEDAVGVDDENPAVGG